MNYMQKSERSQLATKHFARKEIRCHFFDVNGEAVRVEDMADYFFSSVRRIPKKKDHIPSADVLFLVGTMNWALAAKNTKSLRRQVMAEIEISRQTIDESDTLFWSDLNYQNQAECTELDGNHKTWCDIQELKFKERYLKRIYHHLSQEAGRMAAERRVQNGPKLGDVLREELAKNNAKSEWQDRAMGALDPTDYPPSPVGANSSPQMPEVGNGQEIEVEGQTTKWYTPTWSGAKSIRAPRLQGPSPSDFSKMEPIEDDGELEDDCA